MKLLTHNMMQSHVKGISRRFPLLIKPETVRVVEQVKNTLNSHFFKYPRNSTPISSDECSAESSTRLSVRLIQPRSLAKMPLEQAMTWLGHEGKLPKECPNQDENNEDILKAIHHALLEVEMVEGKLVCPESGREFPVKNGIPNMLLNEDEV
jgi:multifunctional methyltransferase subunit TRM112